MAQNWIKSPGLTIKRWCWIDKDTLLGIRNTPEILLHTKPSKGRFLSHSPHQSNRKRSLRLSSHHLYLCGSLHLSHLNRDIAKVSDLSCLYFLYHVLQFSKKSKSLLSWTLTIYRPCLDLTRGLITPKRRSQRGTVIELMKFRSLKWSRCLIF